MPTAPDAATTTERPDAPRETVYRPRHPLDLIVTVGALASGPWDPTMARDGDRLWWARRTPLGVATLALRQAGDEVRAAAWGPGAEAALDEVPMLCGAMDSTEGFDPSRHPLVAELARRMPGLRLARTGQVFDALAQAVLEQKVTSLAAYRAWRRLVMRFGTAAPGPTPRPMFAAPAPDGWSAIPSWEWHEAGVEPPQSRAITGASARGERIERAVLADGADADRVLTSLAGIGVWTSAETRARALGDPDAVSLGDYHLPHEVGFALTGVRTDDAGMLELLAPWVGHRQRVIRLLFAGGPREARRGPRLAPIDHRGR